MTDGPHCCRLDPETGAPCSREAVWLVYGDTGHFEDYTHACFDHVIEMQRLFGGDVQMLP